MLVLLRRPVSAALLAAATLVLTAAPPSLAATVRIGLDEESIRREGDIVVLTAEDGSTARIRADGELTVRGRRVATSERIRRDLRRYHRGIEALEEHAKEIGLQAVELAFSAIGEAVLALATGDEGRAERRLEGRAEPIKEQAKALCAELEALIELQDRIARRLPEFRPYAVIDSDRNDCTVDD